MESSNLSRDRINKILSSSDPYVVLGISKTATKDEMKKAYFKAALLVHPDKTKEPKAEEAFKKLSHVYQALRDGKKVEQQGSRTEPKKPNPSPKPQKQKKTYEGSFDDIFANFFKNKMKQEYVSPQKRVENREFLMKWYYDQRK